MEPGHDPRRRKRGRWLRLPRQAPAGLQPHPPQRRRLLDLRRLPLPAHDRAPRILPGGGGLHPRRPVSARLLTRRRAGPARLLLGPPQPGRRRRHRRRADRDDPDRDGPLHLSPEPPLELADRCRRQRPARRLRRSRHRSGTPGNHRHRLQRALLRPAPSLQGLLRRDLQPALRRLRDLEGQPARPRVELLQRKPGAGRQSADERRRRRLRDLRHQPQPGGPGPRRHLLRQRRRGPRQPRGGKPRPRLRDHRGEGAAPLERLAGPGPRQRRSRTAPRHLLHGALPRLSGASDLQRRRRRLSGDGRPDPSRPRPHPVRRLLRLGRLPQRDAAALAAGAGTGQPDDALAARRRRPERLPAALALRQRPEHDHGRRLRRPDARLGRRLRRRRLRSPRRPGSDGQGRDPALPERQRRIPGAAGPRRLPGARLRPLRPRHQRPQRQLDLRPPRSRLGLGGDLARVRRRRLRDRPVRRPLPGRPRDVPHVHGPLRQLAAPLRTGQRHDRAALSPAAPSPSPTTTSTAAASSRATPPSTPGWCPRTRAA